MEHKKYDIYIFENILTKSNKHQVYLKYLDENIIDVLPDPHQTKSLNFCIKMLYTKINSLSLHTQLYL